ncbi:MAG: hypothetical protein P4L87_25170 [Formivibrio sp.]|nr:hypothetical protein [Formivibrio sp.]
MAVKKFTVREGYSYELGEKDYAAGEVVELEEALGNSAHQLQSTEETQTAGLA